MCAGCPQREKELKTDHLGGGGHVCMCARMSHVCVYICVSATTPPIPPPHPNFPTFITHTLTFHTHLPNTTLPIIGLVFAAIAVVFTRLAAIAVHVLKQANKARSTQIKQK